MFCRWASSLRSRYRNTFLSEKKKQCYCSTFIDWKIIGCMTDTLVSKYHFNLLGYDPRKYTTIYLSFTLIGINQSLHSFTTAFPTFTPL